MKTNEKKWRIVSIAIMVGLLALDRASKVLFEIWLADKGLIELIPGFLGLRLLHGGNTGAAWGILSGNTALLAVITFVILVAILYVLFVKRLRSSWLRIAAVFIAAGGLGNLYDRVVYGAVTDFFEFLFIQFPIFNVADCCVSVGAVMMVLWLLFSKNNTKLFVDDQTNQNADANKPEDENGSKNAAAPEENKNA